MSKSPWKPWHEVVKLRDDLRSGELPLHMFAADLYEVIMQRGKRPVYEKPEQFFALTVPTYNLRKLVRDVVLRLAGKNDKAVRQLEPARSCKSCPRPRTPRYARSHRPPPRQGSGEDSLSASRACGPPAALGSAEPPRWHTECSLPGLHEARGWDSRRGNEPVLPDARYRADLGVHSSFSRNGCQKERHLGNQPWRTNVTPGSSRGEGTIPRRRRERQREVMTC